MFELIIESFFHFWHGVWLMGMTVCAYPHLYLGARMSNITRVGGRWYGN
ncbi:hypothetical protein [Sediminibacterium sp.]